MNAIAAIPRLSSHCSCDTLDHFDAIKVGFTAPPAQHKDLPPKRITNLVYQPIDENLPERTADERPVLELNAASWGVMRGTRLVRLVEANKSKPVRTKAEQASRVDVDQALFEKLRALRRETAAEHGVAALVVMLDSTPRELTAIRPPTIETLRDIRGERKISGFGDLLIEQIAHARK